MRKMTTTLQHVASATSDSDVMERVIDAPASGLASALLTGGIDRPYAYGMSLALASKGVKVDVIGNRELECPEICEQPKVTFLALHGDLRQKVSAARRLVQHLAVYWKLIRY